MPSRIDIGPEGGPFVAINENSNDLELQDINGNVIAVWDETAGEWDLNNNSLTNINAIDADAVAADDLTITSSLSAVELGVSDDPTAMTQWLQHLNNNGGVQNKRAVTQIIADGSPQNITDTIGTTFTVVAGRSASSRFVDLVLAYIGGVSKVSSVGSSASRSYSLVGLNEIAVSISDGGSSYNVVADQILLRPQSP